VPIIIQVLYFLVLVLLLVFFDGCFYIGGLTTSTAFTTTTTQSYTVSQILLSTDIDVPQTIEDQIYIDDSTTYSASLSVIAASTFAVFVSNGTTIFTYPING